MAGTLFWVVTRDGKGRWTKTYDPKGEVKGGTRFEFEVRAEQYVKQKKLEDKCSDDAAKAAQGDLL